MNNRARARSLGLSIPEVTEQEHAQLGADAGRRRVLLRDLPSIGAGSPEETAALSAHGDPSNAGRRRASAASALNASRDGMVANHGQMNVDAGQGSMGAARAQVQVVSAAQTQEDASLTGRVSKNASRRRQGAGPATKTGELPRGDAGRNDLDAEDFITEEPVEDDDRVDDPDEGNVDEELVSTSVGALRRKERAERLRRSSRRYIAKMVTVIGVIVALLAGWAVLYNSPAFTIQNVKVNGVEHLTGDEMTALANVPADTTLLRVDADTIQARVKQSSWVEDVSINRVFPDTLEINVTERAVQAIVEMPSKTGTTTKRWAIAEDRTWLMPIPDADSEAAQTTSAKIYEDAESAVQITDLPFGTEAEIGQICSDAVVNNALDILQEMTTSLAGQVVKISAASTAETSLYLDNGIEIAFGSAENIRDKERTILKIMEENPDGVTYINVRMVENPTWRSI